MYKEDIHNVPRVKVKILYSKSQISNCWTTLLLIPH